jgi:hypothetical protein
MAAMAIARPALSAGADSSGPDLRIAPLERLAHTGVLYDRVVPLAHLELHDGSATAPVADLATWRQAFDELHRASIATPQGPDLTSLLARTRTEARPGTVPLALLDRAFDRVRPGAGADGAIEVGSTGVLRADPSALVSSRAFLATALVPRVYRGADLEFVLAPEDVFADEPIAPGALTVDFDDGEGPRAVVPGERVRVAYDRTGQRVLTLRLSRSDGTSSQSRFAFDVAALSIPLPNDTLHVTATVPFQGQYGTGDAYVYLAPGHTTLVNPNVVIEGFDLDNSMNWDELYELLDQQGLIETLRAEGFDAVVLNFTDATLPIEENGLLVAQLIQQVEGMIPPTTSIALVGPSMGALCSRYALDWMETQGIPYRVRTWISFDGPMTGANIPLGVQYWIDFFSGQSSDAAAFRATLLRPAAREMLLNHFDSGSGAPDPMRASMLADFAALGDYPKLTRRVGIANGSGTGANQGFAPGAQVIRWEYSSFLVSITGDVWALPNLTSGTIFKGNIRIVLPTSSETITITNSPPWDGAPGGSRDSFAELDSVPAPYGDIVALYRSHCFIPTVSALGLSTTDPFYNIAGDAALLSHTPFDAVYYPTENQEHVTITPENAAWIEGEITRGLLDVPGPAAPRVASLRAAGANPFAGRAKLVVELPGPRDVDVAVYSIGGQRVRSLSHGSLPAGRSTVDWDGLDQRGAPARPGVYLVRMTAGSESSVSRIVKLD